MTTFVIGVIVAAFIVGMIVGGYGHKWIAHKAASAGITPPPKLP